MNKIKDLIYDYNDIFVALLIIAVAGAIIFWRVSGIMAYPDYLAGKGQAQTGEVDFSGVDLNPEDVGEFNENPEDITTQNPEGEGQSGEETPAETPSQDDPTQTAQTDGNGNYIVEIPKGSSAIGIARLLKAQGIISDEDAFMEKVEELGATMKMKYGTYKIPQGSSAEEIINILM